MLKEKTLIPHQGLDIFQESRMEMPINWVENVHDSRRIHVLTFLLLCQQENSCDLKY